MKRYTYYLIALLFSAAFHTVAYGVTSKEGGKSIQMYSNLNQDIKVQIKSIEMNVQKVAPIKILSKNFASLPLSDGTIRFTFAIMIGNKQVVLTKNTQYAQAFYITKDNKNRLIILTEQELQNYRSQQANGQPIPQYIQDLLNAPTDNYRNILAVK